MPDVAAFTYSFDPSVDDHGMTIEACVGRDADSDATIVWLHHDWESDWHLYGYRAGGLFAKVFVVEVRGPEDPDPMWEVRIGPFRCDPSRSAEPSADEIASHTSRIVDGLSQYPVADVRHAIPGAVVRRIEVKPLFNRSG
jgi:hypothetical protein